ncbi:hypothetical protein KR018_000536 [Drosophila ironensis]|nr:hypothetical protein KR018_000536 [Drosophila ironensis]
MGGKSYFCDYCCCFLKNDLNVRRKHNYGIAHTIAKKNYMRRFEDPQKILNEERLKQPCQRYFNGYCKFEMFCKNSHYDQQQLQKLQKLVEAQTKKDSRKKKKPRRWPWKTRAQKELPPSLREIDLAKLKHTNWELSWG